MKKKILIAFLIALLCLLIIGCKKENKKDQDVNAGPGAANVSGSIDENLDPDATANGMAVIDEKNKQDDSPKYTPPRPPAE